MHGPHRLLCHRCGYERPDGSDELCCPRDGLHLVTQAEHLKASRDIFLGTSVGGRYPILGILGQGGMGAVYRSVQPLVEREVAVKLVLPSQDANRELATQRFLREAKAIAKLDHPAIVTLHDFGVEEDGTAFMVMELVQGQTLSRALRGQRVPRARLVEICLEVLEALEVAHEQGLVHRDLKPENVMLLDRAVGRHTVKVLDFGLAKLVEAGASSGPQLTKSGAVFGTPQYMAPEQALGEEVDHRTDLYALGVILFQGLAGRPPYESDQALVLMRAHVSAPIPALPRDVGPGLAAVGHRALAKERGERFEDASAMGDALRAAREDLAEEPGGEDGEVAAEAAAEAALARSVGDAETIDSPLDSEDTQVRPMPAEATEPPLSSGQPAVADGEPASLATFQDAAGEVVSAAERGSPGRRSSRRLVRAGVVGVAVAAGLALVVALWPDAESSGGDVVPAKVLDRAAPVAVMPAAPDAPARFEAAARLAAQGDLASVLEALDAYLEPCGSRWARPTSWRPSWSPRRGRSR